MCTYSLSQEIDYWTRLPTKASKWYTVQYTRCFCLRANLSTIIVYYYNVALKPKHRVLCTIIFYASTSRSWLIELNFSIHSLCDGRKILLLIMCSCWVNVHVRTCISSLSICHFIHYLTGTIVPVHVYTSLPYMV